MSVLKDKTIVVGVSGGIAAYKSAELVRLLVTRGAKVRVMMTRNACEFITPLTLQTLSQNPVASDTFSLTQESEIGHIRLADSADAIVIAPATADVIAKAAVGIADDLVTTVLLAARCPVAFAPAMNVHMYQHPTVAENLARLKSRGVTIIDPAEGELACGYEGKGRLPDPGDDRRGNRADALAARPGLGAGAGYRRPHSGGDRPGAVRVESFDRARWASRSPGRLGGGAHRSDWSRARRRSRNPMASSESTR